MSDYPKNRGAGSGSANRSLYTDGGVGPSGRPIPLDPDALLDEAEAAFLIRVSPHTLQAQRLRGGGPPFVRLGKRRGVRYRRGTLVQYSIDRERRSTSDSGGEGR